MVNYYFKGKTFVIEDYQNAKTFASFLPAVSGEDGKPLWAFYANVGQCMGGFGVNSKDTPITPFDSATLAYQNIPIKGFRTFLRVDGEVFSPFFHKSINQTMLVNKSNFTISEENNLFDIKVTYSSVPRENYAGLIRKVTIKNKSSTKNYKIVDGNPIFFPNGLSNIVYKELVSLMAAYCQIDNFENKAPYVKFKTSTGDNPIVSETINGNGFVSFDEFGEKLNPIVDLVSLFGNDLSLLSPINFINQNYKDFVSIPQQLENKLPCAFSTIRKTLARGESYTFYSLFGSFDTIEQFKEAINKLNKEKVDSMIDESEKLIIDLLSPMKVHTSNELFDNYLEQSLLDNNLRGGFPTLLKNGFDGEVYYIYSRKHGDMERDYNSFQIPSKYFSSGAGNFRDVNQNRRNDLVFYPFVKDYNIFLFFSLIQIDGQNPLNISPLQFAKNVDFDENILSGINSELKKQIKDMLKGFEPSLLYTFISEHKAQFSDSVDEIFSKLLGQCHQEIKANFAEGYWVDHWTYNVDLLENYINIYPDKLDELLFKKEYKYFYSPIFVEPRNEKYCLLPDGKVRQYGAIDLKKAKKECERLNLSLLETYWLKDGSGNEIKTDLASKIVNLITIKFSTLDNLSLGIEMECEKPGWNDAMNGLPGLFSSGMSESIELLRLINFALFAFEGFKDRNISLLNEQYKLFESVKAYLLAKNKEEITQFEYWDKVSTSREEFRQSVRYSALGKTTTIKIEEIYKAFVQFKLVLEKGIDKSRKIGGGILPTYLIYDVKDYVKNDYINHLGYQTVKVKEFALRTIPPFLESSARVLKLGPKLNRIEDYLTIRQSDLYDHKLKFYKTCASLDNAPFEIGRVHAFTKGWLERECNFLHMSYKYLLGLLKAGFYKEFYEECKTNLVFNMDVNTYGRSPIENSSFIVPTCNPDPLNHGRGFFARLTGANAEILNMYVILFMGENMFTLLNKELHFALSPKLSKEYFDKNDEVEFVLFNTTKVTYHNPLRLDCYASIKLTYIINKINYTEIKGQLAQDIRDGKIKEMIVEIGEKQ